METPESQALGEIIPPESSGSEQRESPANALAPRKKGDFVKGDPRINRGGRPRNTITSALYKKLEQSGSAEKAAEKLWKHAIAGKPNISLQAICAIQDRTEGKAVQAHIVGHVVDENTAKRLADLADKFSHFLE